VASDGNGLQNLIAIISELRRSAGAACGRPVQTYCPIGPLHRSCLASEGARTGTWDQARRIPLGARLRYLAYGL